MNLDHLQTKLIEAARQVPPSEQVPYAFEKRITARLRAGLGQDPWLAWSRALWRAAAPCVAVSVLLVAWTIIEPDTGSGGPDLAQQFEETVLADLHQDSILEATW